MSNVFETSVHVGIIMDGNGRSATSRGLLGLAGHEAGIEALRLVADAAPFRWWIADEIQIMLVR